MLQRLRAPATVCSGEEENEDDFESSSPAKACSSTTPLPKFLVFFVLIFEVVWCVKLLCY